MDIRKLKYFATVVKEGSFTKAAEQLLVAQPAISRSIQSLEEELSVLLLDRTQRGITLTPAGELLYEHANQIISMVNKAKQEISQFRSDYRREVRIAVPHLFGKLYLLKLISEFKKLQPYIRVSVVEVGLSKISDLIHSGEVEFGILAMDQGLKEEEFVLTPLLKEQVMVCISVDNPLSQAGQVSFQDLMTQPLIVFEEGYFQKVIQNESAKSAKGAPNITLAVNQDAFIHSMVADNLGVALIMKSAITESPLTRILPLEPSLEVTICNCRSNKRKLTKEAQLLYEYIQEKLTEASV